MGTPWVAVLVVGVIGTILTFFGSAIAAITFTSVLIIIMYALIAISAIVHRFKGKHVIPYKMILWPLAPVVGLMGVVIAGYFQSAHDLLICLAIFVVGFLFYFVASRNKTGFWASK